MIARMNYDIHGAVLGLPDKILVFCGSLICASLPVTGFTSGGEEERRKRIALLNKMSNFELILFARIKHHNNLILSLTLIIL